MFVLHCSQHALVVLCGGCCAAGPAGALVECKGLAINQQNPHLLGVACGDPYVRLFDRRRLSTCEWCCASCPRRGGWWLAAVWVWRDGRECGGFGDSCLFLPAVIITQRECSGSFDGRSCCCMLGMMVAGSQDCVLSSVLSSGGRRNAPCSVSCFLPGSVWPCNNVQPTARRISSGAPSCQSACTQLASSQFTRLSQRQLNLQPASRMLNRSSLMLPTTTTVTHPHATCPILAGRPGGGATPALLQLTSPHLPLELAAGMIRRCHATHCRWIRRLEGFRGSVLTCSPLPICLPGCSLLLTCYKCCRCSLWYKHMHCVCVGCYSRLYLLQLQRQATHAGMGQAESQPWCVTPSVCVLCCMCLQLQSPGRQACGVFPRGPCLYF